MNRLVPYIHVKRPIAAMLNLEIPAHIDSAECPFTAAQILRLSNEQMKNHVLINFARDSLVSHFFYNIFPTIGSPLPGIIDKELTIATTYTIDDAYRASISFEHIPQESDMPLVPVKREILQELNIMFNDEYKALFIELSPYHILGVYHNSLRREPTLLCDACHNLYEKVRSTYRSEQSSSLRAIQNQFNVDGPQDTEHFSSMCNHLSRQGEAFAVIDRACKALVPDADNLIHNYSKKYPLLSIHFQNYWDMMLSQKT